VAHVEPLLVGLKSARHVPSLHRLAEECRRVVAADCREYRRDGRVKCTISRVDDEGNLTSVGVDRSVDVAFWESAPRFES